MVIQKPTLNCNEAWSPSASGKVTLQRQRYLNGSRFLIQIYWWWNLRSSVSFFESMLASHSNWVDAFSLTFSAQWGLMTVLIILLYHYHNWEANFRSVYKLINFFLKKPTQKLFYSSAGWSLCMELYHSVLWLPQW